MGRIRTGFASHSEESDLHVQPMNHPNDKTGIDSIHPSGTHPIEVSSREYNTMNELLFPSDVEWFINPNETHLQVILDALKENRHCLLVTPTSLSGESIKEIIKTSHESKVKCYPANPVFYAAALQQQWSDLSQPDFISLRRFCSFHETQSLENLFGVLMNDVMIVLYLMKHDVKRSSASVIRNTSGQIQMVEARLEFSHSKVTNLLFSNGIPSEQAYMEVFRSDFHQRMPLLQISEKENTVKKGEMPSVEKKEMDDAVYAMRQHLWLCLNGTSKEELTPELLLQTTEVTRTILKSIEFLNEE